MYHLSNDQLNITIAAKGAELQSIYHTGNQLEYMWSGDPAFWSKKSPVLFPVVGGLKNNSYTYKGIEYPLGRHGFAREREFTLSYQNKSSICFTLESDEESLKSYPFQFRFSVLYTLQESQLTITYQVENTGSDMMYFSVGAHPAFAVPLVEETDFSDYYLSFSHIETAPKWPLSPDGLIESAPINFLDNTNRLALTKEMFYGDALVCKQLASNSISILSNKTKHGLTVRYDHFPYMGIWSARNADFICIEPWCGIADSVLATSDITKKEGINNLHPGAVFTRNWSIEVF